MLDAVSLVHMNGRVYDPKIGRFMSADPFIDCAANSQGWNRYTYVKNRPLSLWDPSGFGSRIRVWREDGGPPIGGNSAAYFGDLGSAANNGAIGSGGDSTGPRGGATGAGGVPPGVSAGDGSVSDKKEEVTVTGKRYSKCMKDCLRDVRAHATGTANMLLNSAMLAPSFRMSRLDRRAGAILALSPIAAYGVGYVAGRSDGFLGQLSAVGLSILTSAGTSRLLTSNVDDVVADAAGAITGELVGRVSSPSQQFAYGGAAGGAVAGFLLRNTWATRSLIAFRNSVLGAGGGLIAGQAYDRIMREGYWNCDSKCAGSN
ncbi:MAG: RHS repeat-associated core domain-containing protein [Steroidobacteraceae bacterium]